MYTEKSMKGELLILIVYIIGSCLKVLSVYHYLFIYSSNFNNQVPDLLSDNEPVLLLRCYRGEVVLCAAVIDRV